MGYLIKPLRKEELAPAFVSVQKENEDLRKTLGARKTIERPKGILMKSQWLSEAQAFSLIQRKGVVVQSAVL